MRTFGIIIFVMVGICAYSQSAQKEKLIFINSSGDSLFIEDEDILKDKINTNFIKNNLSEISFIEDRQDTTSHFNIYLVDLRRIKRNQTYDLSVRIIKQNPSTEEILKSFGIIHYKLILKKINNNYHIDSLVAVSGEI